MKSDKMRDLKRRNLKGSAVNFKPFFFEETDSDGVKRQEGIEFDMAVTLADSVNAELDIGLPLSGLWGKDSKHQQKFVHS